MSDRHIESNLHNPFDHRKLPKDRNKKLHKFISKNDIEILTKEYETRERRDFITILQLLEKYGFRIGIFENMTMDKKTRKWISKEREYTGIFTRKEVENVIKYNVLGMKSSVISSSILALVRSLYKRGLIAYIFSAHDIRRYYIKRKLKSCKNGLEIADFSRSIHKNYNTTLGYIYD
jgi:hypothetical protein